MVRAKAGIWRNGAMMCARSATCWVSSEPIVLGASFGGMVALAYATRHPAHPSKLVLISTAATGGSHRERRVELFERFGGPEVGALARRRFLEIAGPSGSSIAGRLAAIGHAALYAHSARSRRGAARGQSPGGAAMVHPTRWREVRPSICSPRPGTASSVLPWCMGGEDDPIHPIESQADIAAALPAASGAIRTICRIAGTR